MPQEQVEEYLEAIFDIAGKDGIAKTSDVASRLDKSPASVTEIFISMDKTGLVIYTPYKGVTLTEKGLHEAEKIKRKHRLLEVLLVNHLRVRCKKVHEEACKMEHSISDDIGNAICRLLEAPARCPSGELIFPCDKAVETCNECETAGDSSTTLRSRNVVPITDLEPSEKGTIAFLRGSKNIVQRLCDLGLTPRTEVVLLRKTPMGGPIELSVRKTKLAIGHDIADNIFIEAPSGVRHGRWRRRIRGNKT
jgi:DtxR family Mn-dependent transcriptional regulator